MGLFSEMNCKSTPILLRMREAGVQMPSLYAEHCLWDMFMHETLFEHPLIWSVYQRLVMISRISIHHRNIIMGAYENAAQFPDEFSIVLLASRVSRNLRDYELLTMCDEIKMNTL